jgi:hypothetical protein
MNRVGELQDMAKALRNEGLAFNCGPFDALTIEMVLFGRPGRPLTDFGVPPIVNRLNDLSDFYVDARNTVQGWQLELNSVITACGCPEAGVSYTPVVAGKDEGNITSIINKSPPPAVRRAGCLPDGSEWQMGQGILAGTWIHIFPDGSSEVFDALGVLLGKLPPGSRPKPNCQPGAPYIPPPQANFTPGCQPDGSEWVRETRGMLRGYLVHIFADGSYQYFDMTGTRPVGNRFPPGSRPKPDCPVQGKATTVPIQAATGVTTYATVVPVPNVTAWTNGAMPAPGPVQCPPGMAAVTVGIGPNQKIICQKVTATAVGG